MAKSSIKIEGVDVVLVKQGGEDYISLTDMARYKNLERTNFIIQNWMRTRYTIEFMGLWEKIHNPASFLKASNSMPLEMKQD